MTINPAKITVLDMEASPEIWERFELQNGEPIEMTYTKPIHARLLMKLGYKIQSWIDSKTGFGEVYGGEAGIKFNEETRYCFDLAWSDIRIDETEIPTRSLPLMIEIVSEGNDISKLLSKVEDYLQYGAKEVWLVFPAKKTIQAYYPNNTARTFHLEDTIGPIEFMKDFSLSLKEIFQ